VTSERRSLSEPGIFSPGNRLVFVLVTALFLLWGIPANLNNVLIKQFMKSFEISRFQAGLIQSAFYMGYFLLALPAALIMRKYSYKTGFVFGLMLYGTGALLFWPAAVVRHYGFFLLALFVMASGLAFLETGANPFIAVLGDPRTSERRLNFSQAFNPLGSIGGVVVGTVFIFSGIELKPAQVEALKATGKYGAYLQQETLRVVTPYAVLGCFVFFWALLIVGTRFPKVGEESETSGDRLKGRFRELLKYPQFVQGVLAQFSYIGAKVGTWSYFITYIQDYTGLPERTAGYFLTGTLVAFTIGRFLATYLMRFIEPRKLMGFYSLANMGLFALGVLLPGWIGLWAIFLTSFFMSLMFPTIFALGIKGLGPNTKIGGSMIVMAMIGGAVFTPVMGLIFEATRSMATAMLVPLACYVFITYYAFVGSRTPVPEPTLVRR
jgi:FHS family L-fucose permease-like MFS transporter